MMKMRVAAVTCAAVAVLFTSVASSWADSVPIKSGLQFVGGQVHLSSGLLGKVWAVDAETGIRKTIVEIKADMGPKWDKLTRAKTVAERLNNEYQKNPTFYTKMFRDRTSGGETVLTTDHNGQWIIMADEASARLNHQTPDEYANAIKDMIQKVLSDPSVR